jgi:multidrug efflux pump subunit AcrA (membrane-fusion protein)
MNQPLHETTQKKQIASSRRLLWFLVLPAALCAGGLFTLVARNHTTKALAAETKGAAAEPVAVFHAKSGETTEELVMPAVLQAFDESPVYARVNGYVAKWYTDIGTHVQAGQLLAVIDAPQVDQQLAQAHASLNQARANLSLADVTTKRYQDLIGSNSVSQQELDNNVQNQAVQNANVQSATKRSSRLSTEWSRSARRTSATSSMRAMAAREQSSSACPASRRCASSWPFQKPTANRSTMACK